MKEVHVHIRGICTDRFEYTAQTGKISKIFKNVEKAKLVKLREFSPIKFY